MRTWPIMPTWIKVKNLLDETVSETRNIARNMQPGALMEFGLTKAD